MYRHFARDLHMLWYHFSIASQTGQNKNYALVVSLLVFIYHKNIICTIGPVQTKWAYSILKILHVPNHNRTQLEVIRVHIVGNIVYRHYISR